MKPDLIEHVIRPSLPAQFAERRLPSVREPDRATSSSAVRTPTAVSPAARSSSTPTAAWPATAAARSRARTRPRSTVRPPTPCARSRRRSSRPGSRSGARRRSRTRSVSRTRCRSWSTRSARRGLRREARSCGARGVRHAARGDHRPPRPAPPDLQAHRRLRPLRSHRRRRLHLGEHVAVRRRAAQGGRLARPARFLLARACRVLPDVTAVDRVFDYSVPDALADAGARRRDRARAAARPAGPRLGGRRRGRARVDQRQPAGSARGGVGRARRPTWSRWRNGSPGAGRGRASPCSAPRAAPNNVPPGAGRGRRRRSSSTVAPGVTMRVIRQPPLLDRRAQVAALCAATGSTIVCVADAGAVARARRVSHRRGRAGSR